MRQAASGEHFGTERVLGWLAQLCSALQHVHAYATRASNPRHADTQTGRQAGRQGPRQVCYSRVWDPLALDRHRVLHRDLKTQNVFLTAAVLLALALTLTLT